MNDSSPAAVAKRIGQKVRRVESGHIPFPCDLAVKRTSQFSASESSESGRTPRSLASSNESYGKPPQTIAPAIDLKKITDDVMQQIDRRIVANRERFGKI